MGWLQDFTGSSAKKDLRRSKAAADAELTAGYNEASGQYDDAYDLFNGYASQGAEGATAYRNALLGTPEQKQALYDNYTSDPGMQGLLGLQSNALLRRLNSAGSGTGGGKLALAGARVAQEGYGGFLDRLSGLGQQGFAATSSQAGIRTGLGDMRMNLAGTRAGNEVSFGNAMAQNRSTLSNNLLNVAGTAVKAYAASDIRLKRDIERVGTLPSGLPLYDFKYLWSDDVHRGVMAQEALHYAPGSVAIHPSGFYVVDYNKVG